MSEPSDEFDEVEVMRSTTLTTVTMMIESLPEEAQDRVVEHLREYIEDLRDEMKWDVSFKKTQTGLIEAARRVRQEIAEGKAVPMDDEQL
jgi:hypothetical protein